jgi:hypothetical protein
MSAAPAQQQRPDKSLRELAQLMFDQVDRIEAVQGALVDGGFCGDADRDQLALADDFRAIGKLIDFVRSDELMIARLRELALGARRAEAAREAAAAAEAEKVKP